MPDGLIPAKRSMPVKFGQLTTTSGKTLSYHLTYVETSFGVSWQAEVRDADGQVLRSPRGLLAGAMLSTPHLEQRLVSGVKDAIASI